MSADDQICMRLTREGVASAKRRLWQLNKSIKSSTLSEAIARAAGFATHAALLAACDKSNRAETTVMLTASAINSALEKLYGAKAKKAQKMNHSRGP